MLIELSREQGSIVSTGGGLVLRDVNREIMRNTGVIVLLDRPLEGIMGDIKLNRRPLLAQKGLGEVERLYHERIDLYRKAAGCLHADNSHGLSGRHVWAAEAYHNHVQHLRMMLFPAEDEPR